MIRSEATQGDKIETFKNAFQTYNKYMGDENYLAAFVIAFSILEDRVTAMCITIRAIKANSEKFVGFVDRVRKLRMCGAIIPELHLEMLSLAKFRNAKLHAAMWNIDEITEGDCKRVKYCAREADRLQTRLKKANNVV